MGNAIRIVEDNVEATEAWNGPLFEVWMEYRGIVADGLNDHGEAAIALDPPSRGTGSSTSAAGSARRP